MTARRALVALVALVACASSAGCYTLRADIPGTWRPAAPHEDIVVVGHVDERVSHVFFLDGLLPQTPTDIYAGPLLRAVEKAGGDGVANVILDSELTTGDVIFRTLTLGIVTPRSYRVRADVVRIPGPPPPGRPLLHRKVAPAPVPPPDAATPPPDIIAPPPDIITPSSPPSSSPAPPAGAPLDPSEPPPPLTPEGTS